MSYNLIEAYTLQEANSISSLWLSSI